MNLLCWLFGHVPGEEPTRVICYRCDSTLKVTTHVIHPIDEEVAERKCGCVIDFAVAHDGTWSATVSPCVGHRELWASLKV